MFSCLSFRLIQQLVRQHIRNGALERGGIKAIYVAPMKALAQEVVAKFSQRLKPLGLVRDGCCWWWWW